MREEIEGKISKTSARLKAKMNIYILIVKHTRSNKSNAHVSVAYNSFILCLIYLSLRIVSSLGSCTEVNNWRDQKADARNAHVSENQENAESILTCYRAVSRPSWTFRWRPCQWRRRWSFVSFGLGQWIACLFIYICFKVRKIVLEGRAKCLRKTLCLYFLPLFFSRFPQSFPIWVLGVLGHAAVISAAATSVVRDSYFRHLATCTPQHLSSPFLFFLYCWRRYRK